MPLKTGGMGIVEVYTAVWWENLKEKYHLEDQGIDARIILKFIFRKWDVRACIGSNVAQGGDWWWALVNAIKNFRVPLNAGNFLTS
jgi:hypothetical protein